MFVLFLQTSISDKTCLLGDVPTVVGRPWRADSDWLVCVSAVF